VEQFHLSIEVRLAEARLLLAFEPRRCVWTMTGAREYEGSNFDRLLKTARQALTLDSPS
jgi:hypothetical protein